MNTTSVTIEPGDMLVLTFGTGATVSAATPVSSSSSGSSSAPAVSSATASSSSTVSSGGTAVATPPADSPVGTTITGPGQALYVAGQAYEITAGGEIQITPWQGASYIVTSSSEVVSITVVATSASNPTGLQQTNKAGQIWTVAAINVAGSYVGQVSSSSTSSATVPATPKPGLTAIGQNTVIPAGTLGNLGTSKLYRPSTAGAQLCRLSAEQGDWAALIKTLSPEGQGGGLCSKIPCPNGHLDWEYGNQPEAGGEYYLDISEVTPAIPSPFSIDAAGNMVITCKQNVTPNANQKWLSGCLTTAGNQGVFFARDYGYFVTKLKFSGFGPGFWPAKWLLSDDAGGGNPDFNYCREVDAEWWQNLQSVHFGLANANDPGVFVPMDPNSEFTIGFDIRSGQIAWDLNGVVGHTQPTNYPGVHCFPIFNIAVGVSGWAGDPPPIDGSLMTMTIEEFAVFA
jgi:hypothetical protein